MLFEKMNRRYGITPNLDHHTCMVDVFGRAGHFDMALSLIHDMLPFSNFLPLWHSLLGACKRWGNVKLGRFAFNRVMQVDNRDTAAYVLMANIYASAGMHKDAENIEAMRAENSA
jgi:pentatricopeptide repeat protein